MMSHNLNLKGSQALQYTCIIFIYYLGLFSETKYIEKKKKLEISSRTWYSALIGAKKPPVMGTHWAALTAVQIKRCPPF